MLMSCPSQWDLGKMIMVNTKTEENQSNNTKMDSEFQGQPPPKQLDLPPVTPVANLSVKAATETSYTVANLTNMLSFKACKFCEAYLVDGSGCTIKEMPPVPTPTATVPILIAPVAPTVNLLEISASNSQGAIEMDASVNEQPVVISANRDR